METANPGSTPSTSQPIERPEGIPAPKLFWERIVLLGPAEKEAVVKFRNDIGEKVWHGMYPSILNEYRDSLAAQGKTFNPWSSEQVLSLADFFGKPDYASVKLREAGVTLKQDDERVLTDRYLGAIPETFFEFSIFDELLAASVRDGLVPPERVDLAKKSFVSDVNDIGMGGYFQNLVKESREAREQLGETLGAEQASKVSSTFSLGLIISKRLQAARLPLEEFSFEEVAHLATKLNLDANTGIKPMIDEYLLCFGDKKPESLGLGYAKDAFAQHPEFLQALRERLGKKQLQGKTGRIEDRKLKADLTHDTGYFFKGKEF